MEAVVLRSRAYVTLALVFALCVSAWSQSTAACGHAANGLRMALFGSALAAGEGGAGPAGQPLVLQLFPREQRTPMLSCLLAASAVGLGAGLRIAGPLSEHFDWPEVMVAVCFSMLIGLVSAIMAGWTARPFEQV